MPTVSVVLSSYNHAKYLRESINSVLNQTYTDFEVIIVDDCSTDGSWKIIESYNDPRIIKVRNEKNELHVFNAPIVNIARGKYIAIHHSDDVWEPTKLAKQVDFLENHLEYGAVFSWANIIDEEGKPFSNEAHFYYRIFEQPNRSRQEWLRYFFYTGNALCHPSVLIRKQCYEDCGLYRYGFAQLPDFDMWIRLCLKYEIFVMPEKLIRFRVRNNEENTSGLRPETLIRCVAEFYQILNNYLMVDSFAEFVSVFPSAGQYLRTEGYDIKFVFSMICLEDGASHWKNIFGVNLLFGLMQDSKTREKLQGLYGFSYHDFLMITGKRDAFLIETMAAKESQIGTLNQVVAEKESQIGTLNQVVAEKESQIGTLNQVMECSTQMNDKLQSELAEIYKSRKWRVASILARVASFLRVQ